MKKLLAIYGSPRRGGNSAAALDAALPPFEAAGYEVKKVHPASEDVNRCLGCLSCEKTGACVQKDGMAALYPDLLEADVILFATPVYFYSVPGSAKVFIDRSQALWALKYRFPERFATLTRPGRRGYFIGVGATRGKLLFRGMWLTFKYFYDAVGAELSGKLLYRGLEEKGDFAGDPANAERAEAWAREKIEELEA